MDVFDLVATLKLDSSEYEQDLGGAKETAEKGGIKIGGALKKAAKISGAAIAAGSAAVVALTKQSIGAYQEFEQLEGGIQTLYGEDSKAANQMMQNASKAWKTAGMSANEYMETAIASSAAMISSLGGDTDKAAQLMDMSIIDMSDNVNKMGTSMEAVQNAYRGFSRGNFTMLDNLALGFAGTKEGMQQLLDKAKEYAAANGEVRDFSIDSYADIVEAIHIVQTEMGITGTTAKEASTTIQGSIGAMKSAWTNLLTGLADDNADINKLIDDLITSIIGENGEGGVINNILPAVQRALDGIVKMIATLAPQIIPIITDILIQNLPLIIEAGTQIIVALITGLIQALPQLVAALPKIFSAIKTAFVKNWPALKEAGANLLKMVGEGIVSALHWLDGKLQQVGAAISEGLDKKFQEIREKASETWGKITDAVSEKAEGMRTMLQGKWDAIKSAYEEHGGGLEGIASAAMEGIKQYLTLGWDSINELTGGKLDAIKDKATEIFNEIKDFISGVVDHLKGIFDFDWELPHISLPHFTWSWNDLGVIKVPNISVEWYKKAYDNPYMFTRPTLAGFGDGAGGEMVYGHQNLMQDIKDSIVSVLGDMGNQPIVISVQSVLDGKVVGESVTKYQRSQARAAG